MLRFLRKNKSFAKIALIVLIASLLIGVAGSLLLWATTPDENKSVSNEEYLAEQIKEMEQTLAEYEEQATTNPYDEEVWPNMANLEYNLASLLYETGDFAKGQEYFRQATLSYQKALEYQPDNIQFLTYLATAALYTEQNDLAEKNFKAAIKLDPDYLQARVNYGIFLLSVKNDKQGAINEWEAALATNPENEDVKKSIETLITQATEEQDDETKGE